MRHHPRIQKAQTPPPTALPAARYPGNPGYVRKRFKYPRCFGGGLVASAASISSPTNYSISRRTHLLTILLLRGMGNSHRQSVSPVSQGVVSSVCCRECSQVRFWGRPWAHLTLVLVPALRRHSPPLRLMGRISDSEQLLPALCGHSLTNISQISRRREIEGLTVHMVCGQAGNRPCAQMGQEPEPRAPTTVKIRKVVEDHAGPRSHSVGGHRSSIFDEHLGECYEGASGKRKFGKGGEEDADGSAGQGGGG